MRMWRCDKGITARCPGCFQRRALPEDGPSSCRDAPTHSQQHLGDSSPWSANGLCFSKSDTSPVPWRGFGNGFIASSYFQVHSWGGIAKTNLSIPITAQRWSRKSRIGRGAMSHPRQRSLWGPQCLLPRLWLWIWDPQWAVPVPHEPKAFNLRCVDGVRVGSMAPCPENFQAIAEQNGCSFLLMHWSGGKLQSNNVKQQ